MLPPSPSSTEHPRQFLLRIEQYTSTVNHWSRDTLLRGISQFLKDDALEWYCQLYHTNALPTDWSDFCICFLTQFHSPIRIAQQEQACIECKQYDNETINQFVVRLRSLWFEQKPHEHESDSIKHLFCKTHPDVLNLMNLPRSTSLDTIIREAQNVEEILFLRHKEQRQREFHKSKLFINTDYSSSRSKTATTSTKPNHTTLPSSLETTSRSYAPLQPLLPLYTPLSRNSCRPITCWRCYETGHYSTECPLHTDTISSNQPATTTSDSYPPRPLPPRKTKKPIGSFNGAGLRNSSFIYPHNHWHHINTLHASLPTHLTISGCIGLIPVNFLIDTGSSLTLIDDCLFRKLPSYLTRFRRRPPSTIALRLPNNSLLHIQWTLLLPITLKQTTRWATFYVVRDL